MDTFSVIRHFFTRMSCRFCNESFHTDDVHLIGRGSNYFVVAIHCHSCGKHNGDAAVGVEHMNAADAAAEQLAQHFDSESLSLDDLIEAMARRFAVEDPELTPSDFERFALKDTIQDNDVLEAHEFIQQLDSGWMKWIPEELRASVVLPEVDGDISGQ